ncbi:hypothetical protein GGU11DRAFT_690187 [Lentinula aff. detonsa]|nr:hypothetical protein GGU11DRAFT_690187 [Lentinula aff. detonsa]
MRTIFTLVLFIVSTVSSVSPLSQGSIVVDANGTQLTYTDSGAPNSHPYTTIFAVNGMGFNGGIFSKIQTLAPSRQLRIVAVNRRGYAGSTPLSTYEQNVILNGTADQQAEFSRNIGVELLMFMDEFIQDHNISVFNGDKNSAGGVAVVAWSIGNMAGLSAIAHIEDVPEATRSRLASRIRSLIMQESSSNALGLPAPAQNWVPLDISDPTIPAAHQYTAFAQWVTAYFDHGNLSSRDPDVISWVVPSSFTPFTIFNMTVSQYNTIVDTSINPALDADQLALAPVLEANYRASNFNSTLRGLLPHMENWFITGTRSASFGPYCIWVVEDDNAAAGGGFVNFMTIDGVNHFMHWDDPELTLSVYQSMILS